MMLAKYSLKATTLIAFTVMAVGCSNSYPGEIFDVRKDPSVFNNETSSAEKSAQPIKVFINEQDFFTVSTTRGTGPFDKGDVNRTNRFGSSDFYIFAFRKGQYVQGSNTQLTNETDLRYTAYAEAAKAGGALSNYRDDHRYNCLLDGFSYYEGLPMKLNVAGSGQLMYYLFDQTGNDTEGYNFDWSKVDWSHLRDSVFYYNTEYQDVPYDFFSYYVDNFKPNSSNTHREKDRIYHEITIDGSQDIMCGMAPALDSLIADCKIHNPGKYSPNSPINKLSYEDWNKLMNIGGYCSYAAHRGIDPQVKMTHQLTRLEFHAHAGDESCDSITITGIEVLCPTTGYLTVASNDQKAHPLGFEWIADGSVFLKEPSADGIAPCADLKPFEINWDPSEKNKNWYERKAHKIGGSLMVPPAKEFELRLHFTQKQPIRYDSEETRDLVYTAKYKITLNNKAESFQPGFIYPVHIGVYGLQEIKVSTWVQGWERAADDAVTPIDPDAEITD